MLIISSVRLSIKLPHHSEKKLQNIFCNSILKLAKNLISECIFREKSSKENTVCKFTEINNDRLTMAKWIYYSSIHMLYKKIMWKFCDISWISLLPSLLKLQVINQTCVFRKIFGFFIFSF